MTNVLLCGCQGKMGQVITRLSLNYSDVTIVAGVDKNTSATSSYPVYQDISHVKEHVDVIIDFSNPSLFDSLIDFALSLKIPVVMCTTGLSSSQVQRIHEVSQSIPIFFSANMSMGIQLLIRLVKDAACLLHNDFDIEIIEKHHNRKIDAPSGTALMIADGINSVIPKKDLVFDRHSVSAPRSKSEIGMHSIRAGSISGEHTVMFASNDEIIEISHTALSKDVFGVGAIKACLFLQDKPAGLFSSLS